MTKVTKKEYEQILNKTWTNEELNILEVNFPQNIIDNKQIGTWLKENQKKLFNIGYQDYNNN